MKTTMQTFTSTVTEFGTASHASIMTLDGSTRLRMVAEEKAVRRGAAAIPQAAPVRASVVKEAVAVSVLLGVFTGAFWLLITLIRSY